MKTKNVKITDMGDAWIYGHMPYLMALSELMQRWIISIFPAAAKFFEYMNKRPGLDAIIPAAKRKEIENQEIEKIKKLLGIFEKNIKVAKAVLFNIDGYIAINTAAEQAYDSVAPPTAPPENESPAPFSSIDINKIYDTDLRQFYIDQLANLIDIIYLANYNNNYEYYAEYDILVGDIRRKILSDIVNHAVNYSHHYPAIFVKWTEKTEKITQNFINFKISEFLKNVTTRDTADEDRTELAMLRAREAYATIRGGIASLDATITSVDGDATLYSYIVDNGITSINPEAYTIILDADYYSDIDDIDTTAEQQLLFCIPEDADDDDFHITIKPPRPRTGRAKRLQSQQAFDFAGGDDNA